MAAEDVAKVAVLMAALPGEVNLYEATILPNHMTLVHRQGMMLACTARDMGISSDLRLASAQSSDVTGWPLESVIASLGIIGRNLHANLIWTSCDPGRSGRPDGLEPVVGRDARIAAPSALR